MLTFRFINQFFLPLQEKKSVKFLKLYACAKGEINNHVTIDLSSILRSGVKYLAHFFSLFSIIVTIAKSCAGEVASFLGS